MCIHGKKTLNFHIIYLARWMYLMVENTVVLSLAVGITFHIGMVLNYMFLASRTKMGTKTFHKGVVAIEFETHLA